VIQAWPELVRAVAARYPGRVDRGFVSGKLRHDPIYAALGTEPDLSAARSVVDLGCGRGILLALLAEQARRSGATVELRGIEARASHAAVARHALGEDARIETADLRTAEVPTADAVLLIDVLHYLPRETHAGLLGRIARALTPSGVLFVREIDRDAGVRAWLARTAEHAMSALRGEPARVFAFRGAGEWGRVLAAAGFGVEERPIGEGTPFANVLLVGYREARNSRTRGRSSRATSSNV